MPGSELRQSKEFPWAGLVVPAMGPLIGWALIVGPNLIWGTALNHALGAVLGVPLILWTIVAMFILAPRIARAYEMLKDEASFRTPQNIGALAIALLLLCIFPLLAVLEFFVIDS